MADKQYVYAVARIRSKELSLLSGAFLEQLTAAKDYDECIQLLMEKGWGEDGMTNAADILAIEKRKTWELINELVKDMSVFDVFLYANDYHNLKAAIKEVRMGDEYPGIFMDQGTVDVKLIREAVQIPESSGGHENTCGGSLQGAPSHPGRTALRHHNRQSSPGCNLRSR